MGELEEMEDMRDGTRKGNGVPATATNTVKE
jgi:hypothetical protein